MKEGNYSFYCLFDNWPGMGTPRLVVLSLSGMVIAIPLRPSLKFIV